MTTVAVVLAAGRGQRFGGPISKQYALVSGRPVVVRAVQAFADHPAIDLVWVVGAADEIDHLRELVVPYADDVLPGGSERFDSVAAAVAEAELRGIDHIVVHDAARPLVPASVIARVVQALDDGADAVATVVPLNDTVVELDDGAYAGTPERSRLFAMQTPQGFTLTALAAAHRARGQRHFTDDVSMVAALVPDASIATVQGHVVLHKVTTSADLTTLEAWIAAGLIAD